MRWREGLHHRIEILFDDAKIAHRETQWECQRKRNAEPHQHTLNTDEQCQWQLTAANQLFGCHNYPRGYGRASGCGLGLSPQLPHREQHQQCG